jgi:type II secretion system protein I
MANEIKKYIQNAKGFTLVEVMIAITIFALFITAFMASQGANISGSSQMQEDLMLHNLAQMKLNEALLDKPTFSTTTEKDIKTKQFEEKEFSAYKYTIEYKKLQLPDLSQLLGKQEDENSPKNNDASKKMIYDSLKKNIEEILWQVKVTITNTETKYTYSLATWLKNDDAIIKFDF